MPVTIHKNTPYSMAGTPRQSETFVCAGRIHTIFGITDRISASCKRRYTLVEVSGNCAVCGSIFIVKTPRSCPLAVASRETLRRKYNKPRSELQERAVYLAVIGLVDRKRNPPGDKVRISCSNGDADWFDARRPRVAVLEGQS